LVLVPVFEAVDLTTERPVWSVLMASWSSGSRHLSVPLSL
jgi:hypothetical protein